jgi:hypothetical protein
VQGHYCTTVGCYGTGGYTGMPVWAQWAFRFLCFLSLLRWFFLFSSSALPSLLDQLYVIRVRFLALGIQHRRVPLAVTVSQSDTSTKNIIHITLYRMVCTLSPHATSGLKRSIYSSFLFRFKSCGGTIPPYTAVAALITLSFVRHIVIL